ncbi:hypothetical protein CUN61_09910 [Pseudomonas arsenicoxydans]|uniref:DUF1534 domain-containing protein n=1 Tax=Pseudomonas arsenicoxydans TaxID=702115 RepID=A0A4V0YJN7_9PSED|nr:hypothetical protein CUN61_09910 [Pseudomonas arsenicoxydans]
MRRSALGGSGPARDAVAVAVAVDRSHALRGNAAGDALRPAIDTRLESCARVTRSVTGCIPTRSVGTIRTRKR